MNSVCLRCNKEGRIHVHYGHGNGDSCDSYKGESFCSAAHLAEYVASIGGREFVDAIAGSVPGV